MAFGLTLTGFNRKRFEDITAEIDTALKAALGSSLNLLPTSVIGNLRATLAERETLIWELLEAVYNAMYPDTADGISLDNSVTLTGSVRKPATSSTASIRVFGTLATAIATGFQVSVSDNPSAVFETTGPGVIGAGIDEVQTVSFDLTPDAGSFALDFDGQITASIPYTAAAGDVQTALNNLSNLSAVTVSGSFAAGFVVTFTGADGQVDQPLLVVSSNTLTLSGGGVSITVDETVQGVAPYADIAVRALVAGATVANAGTLTVIETPVFGITSCTNLTDATVGLDRETDAELRLRRLEDLNKAGTGTVEKIRAALRELAGVTTADVLENTTLVTDGTGLPGKAFEAFVSGGADADIADTIWNTKPAGIEPHGDIPVVIADSQGNPQTVKFSRPTPIEIWLIVNITSNSDVTVGSVYPVDGDAQVKAKVLEFAASYYDLGKDVINNLWYSSINEVPGVIGIEVLQGTSNPPTLASNISIDAFEVADFDTSRVTVNS